MDRYLSLVSESGGPWVPSCEENLTLIRPVRIEFRQLGHSTLA